VRDHLAMFVITAGAGIREESQECKRDCTSNRTGCNRWRLRLPRDARNGCIAAYAQTGAFRSADHDCAGALYLALSGQALQLRLLRLSNLDDQQGLWKLLKPDDIGVRLMMDAEAGVSALVFHHPGCAYFMASEEIGAVMV